MRKPEEKLSALGAEIVGALTEFRDALASGVPIEKQFTVRSVELKLAPHPYGALDVKRTRALLKISQALFARYLGVSVHTVRSWEQGTKEPSQMACRFMDEISADPDHYRARLDSLTTFKKKAIEH